MPGMSGAELADTIRTSGAYGAPSLIMMVSLAAGETASRPRQPGVAAEISKPIRRADLYRCVAGALGAGAPQAAPQHAVTSTAASLRARVLVVEDNRINQQICVALLRGFGCEAEVANNGLEGCEAAIKGDYDVVLMDCQMPEMDGFAASAAIRAHEARSNGTRRDGEAELRVPIVALTANAMEGDREKCLAAGMDDYLSKPFNKEQLHSMLRRWTDPHALAA